MRPFLSANGWRTLVAAFLVFFLDQASKTWVLGFPESEAPAQAFSFFGNSLSIVPIKNEAVAFGLLASWPSSAQSAVLFGAALLCFVVAMAFFRSLGEGESANSLALGLLLGGCAGNLADWVARGGFIEIAHFHGFHASTSWNFNIADVCIGVAVAVLLAELLVAEGASRAEQRSFTDNNG